jgi:alcohol dehydrogenase class IV
MEFNFYLPINIHFGRNKINRIGEICMRYGKKALIVTGRNSTKKTGLLYKVINLLEKEGISSIVFDEVKSNPLTTTAEKGAKVAKENSCDFVIGLGGGSALDAAKAIAFSTINPGPIIDYIYGKEGSGALPIIAVTTTAGTGSEGDCFAVLTDPESNDKKSLKSIYVYPKESIVDPQLMTTLPPHIIAPTGFDALCHCIEAYIARNSNPISEALAIKAIEMVTKYLPIVYKDPRNLDAWDKVALSNTIGGMVIDRSGVTLPHGLEHPVSGLLDVVHGEGLAALMITVMKYTYKSSLGKFKDIAKTMGKNVEGLSVEDAALKAIEAIEELLLEINLSPKLSDLGVKEEHIDWLSNNAIKTMAYAINNNPISPEIEDIKELYKKCL